MSERAAWNLGSGFNRLWGASIASNLADGLGRTAVPLIATTLTRDPLLIAILGALAFVPWLLFGLPAGVMVDRIDRRWAMASANSIRVIAALVIALSISTGALSIGLLYACVLVWGAGETIYDTATIAIVPNLVPRSGLERANSRLQAAEQVVQNFVATPIAGVLFAVAIALPVWSTAAGFAVAVALAATLPLAAARPFRHPDAAGAATTTAGADMREAVSYLAHHRFLRGMVLLTSAIGVSLTFAQASVLLFFLQTLVIPPAAIGFATAGVGVGALAGAVLASRLVERFGRGVVMFGSVILSGVGIAAVGFSPNAIAGILIYAVSAFGVAVWNVPWGSLRQQLVPGRLLGRVTGLIRTVGWGLFPIGGVLGGLAARVDLRLPFWIGGAVVSLVMLACARLVLSVDDNLPADGPEERGPVDTEGPDPAHSAPDPGPPVSSS